MVICSTSSLFSGSEELVASFDTAQKKRVVISANITSFKVSKKSLVKE